MSTHRIPLSIIKYKSNLNYPKTAAMGTELTVELQWLEHLWLVYHGCVELVLQTLGTKSYSCKFGMIYGNFLFNIENGIL